MSRSFSFSFSFISQVQLQLLSAMIGGLRSLFPNRGMWRLDYFLIQPTIPITLRPLITPPPHNCHAYTSLQTDLREQAVDVARGVLQPIHPRVDLAQLHLESENLRLHSSTGLQDWRCPEIRVPFVSLSGQTPPSVHASLARGRPIAFSANVLTSQERAAYPGWVPKPLGSLRWASCDFCLRLGGHSANTWGLDVDGSGV
jgi:hypothetical protein